MTTAQRDLIGSDEARKILGVDKKTFLRWRALGRITEVAKGPGMTGPFLFERADVAALAAARAAKAAAPASPA